MNDRKFNDGLGEKLRTVGETPEASGKTKRIAAAGVIALIAAGVALTARYWIGN
ncbi:MAG: hypothetical protein KDK53_14320 [Maritimibacter sp.]|nr:hypothetical protein [Maritimibacter sp.]